MSTELAMNAYILLGNTLNYLINAAPAALRNQLDVPPGALAGLYKKIEPLPPAQILALTNGLSAPDRTLLGRAIRHCIIELSTEAHSVLGLPVDVAQQTLAGLRLNEAGEAP